MITTQKKAPQKRDNFVHIRLDDDLAQAVADAVATDPEATVSSYVRQLLRQELLTNKK